jgi:hypothetical protein
MTDDETTAEDTAPAEEVVVLKAYRQQKTVNIQFEAGGPVLPYRLVSLMGTEKEAFQKFAAEKTVLKNGKPVKVLDPNAAETRLLHLALRDPDGKQVPEAEFKKWANVTLQALLKLVVTMNGLSKDDEDDVKNG